MRTISRIGLAAASSVALTLSLPMLPSHADSDYAVQTTEEDGQAAFYGYGEKLMACDSTWDMETTSARLYYKGELEAEVLDMDGQGGSCGEEDLDIPDGTVLTLKACNIYDQDYRDCNEITVKA